MKGKLIQNLSGQSKNLSSCENLIWNFNYAKSHAETRNTRVVD